MLKLRQVIPPLTLRTPDGRAVRAWDYKQKRNLVAAFLHANCSACEAFFTQLTASAASLAEHEAAALVVLPETAGAIYAAHPPANIVVGADVTGHSQRAFLGKHAFDPTGQRAIGIFVTDCYGELYAQWAGADHAALPGTEDILGWLGQIQVSCEECSTPHWPVD